MGDPPTDTTNTLVVILWFVWFFYFILCDICPSLLLIGGAVDLVASDYARVAKLFYKLALAVRTAELSSHLANHTFFVLYFFWAIWMNICIMSTKLKLKLKF